LREAELLKLVRNGNLSIRLGETEASSSCLEAYRVYTTAYPWGPIVVAVLDDRDLRNGWRRK